MYKSCGRLKPECVSDWVNFDGSDRAWHYISGAPASMASLQTEGVAYLWNLLLRRRLALLADEVGMGKTFQALGVAAALWRRNAGARILVMAPNRDICAHWEREFIAFTEYHYRAPDDRVKAHADGKPIPKVSKCFRLPELAAQVASDLPGPHLYLTTIHALSGLAGDAESESEKLKSAQRAGKELHAQCRRALPQGFDLIIIDEAHYFRNASGGSQRTAAGRAFFGEPPSRIAQHALLLTATPSHTHLDDVANILGFFIGREEGRLTRPVAELMNDYGLRRFRLMAGRSASYTKHQYRKEIPTPCSFNGNPQDEMFFALYQRRLVNDLNILSEKRRLLYGYLEGCESAAPEAEVQQPENALDERNQDFSHAPDTQLLREMSADFRKLFHRAPDHPKYGRLVHDCMPQNLFLPAARPLYEDKHLVFVRRIPSVRELTKRVNEGYDELLAAHICTTLGAEADAAWFSRWRASNWSRDIFNERADTPATGSDILEDPADPEETTEQNGQDDYLGSRIAELFVTKKAKPGTPNPPSTDCSRFSLSLRRPNSILAMFMEPASDYVVAGYSWFYQYPQQGKPRYDYTKAAQVQRLLAVDAVPEGAVSQNYDPQPVHTLWSLVFPHLSPGQQAILRHWATTNPAIAENFSHYIKAGFLFASPVVVELYGWHLDFQRIQPLGVTHTNLQHRYQAFMHFAREHIAGSLLLRYFAAALEGFEQLCTKIVGHRLDDWRKGWRSLTGLSSPAWYASGESSHRQHLILGFNSPFYPNTLVATSVFQEGVNLHMQCRKLHHYGIAWTPGDNEQRVGRIDRLFGKVNHLRNEHGAPGSTLDINYPYLENSFDEDQLGSFIARKYDVEEKMDHCTQGSFDKQVSITRTGWQMFLRQPGGERALHDPYPARFD